MDRRRSIARVIVVWCNVLLAAGTAANAQFKVVGPAPYPPAVAHQKIKALLEAVTPANRQQTVETLTGLLSWYRDILDEELIAAWKQDTRANLNDVMEPLADARVASSVVEFSWREQRATAFQPAYAPMFANLMARFPDSAQPFLDDLLGSPPDLTQPEAETVCRVLLDMPDVGAWRQNALKILPRYRRVAESILAQDVHGSDQEKSYQAQRWLADLRTDGPGRAPGNTPGFASDQQSARRRLSPRPAVNDSTPTGDQVDAAPRQPPPIAPLPSAPLHPAPPPSAPPPATLSYNGAKSGTLESTGGPIPQNAEYVFRNLPPVQLQLDYDTKTWSARLAPGDGQTQKLIVRNKGTGPQKRCVVHWTVVP
jgi:hypothetical protein